MGSPVQSLVQDPQFQSLSPDGQRKAVRGVGGDEFAPLSDAGIDKFISGVRGAGPSAVGPSMGPGSFQTRPGAPVQNVSSGRAFEAENARPLATRALNEFTLGTTSALSGLPETEHPVRDAALSAITPPPLPRTPVDLLTSPYVNPAAALVRSIGERVYGVGKELFAPSGKTTEPLAERAHALGTVTGTATQFAAGGGEAEDVAATSRARSEPRNISKGTKSYAEGLGLPNPPDVEGLGGKGGSEGVNASRDIQIAQKDIAKIERDSPAVGKGSSATFSHARAIKDYMDTLWNESHAGPVLRTSSLPLESGTNSLYAAGKAVLTPEAVDADPAGGRAAQRWLDNNVNKPRTIGSTDQFIRELNSDLETPAAQKAYGPLMARAKTAVRDAAREQLNNALIREGEGSISSANQRWGALKNILDRTIKAGESEAKSEGGEGVLPPWIRTYMFAHMTGIHGGVSVHPAEMFPSTPSKSIVGGAQRLARTSLEPPPVDKTPLLPASTGPDTSGPVRPGMGPNAYTYNPPGPPPPNVSGERTATGTVQPITTGPGTGGPHYTGPLRPPPRTMLPALPETAGQPRGGTGESQLEMDRRLGSAPAREGAEQIISRTNAADAAAAEARRTAYSREQLNAAPATGIVGQEFKRLGVTNLVTPRQLTTLETMLRGPRWRTMAPDERVAAIQSILRGERF